MPIHKSKIVFSNFAITALSVIHKVIGFDMIPKTINTIGVQIGWILICIVVFFFSIRKLEVIIISE